MQFVQYMLLVILLLITETVDKMWHICYNVKIYVNIKVFKNYYDIHWKHILVSDEMCI